MQQQLDLDRRCLARGELRIPPGLRLSFQRFAWPDPGIVERAPPSLGALPLGVGQAGELLLPLAAGECFWIGLSLAPGAAPLSLALAVELRGGETLDALSGQPWSALQALTLRVPETRVIDGIRRGDGRMDVFARAGKAQRHCRKLRFQLGVRAPAGAESDLPLSDAAALRLVDYATFAAESGQPPPSPLDPSAGYQGWRLP